MCGLNGLFAYKTYAPSPERSELIRTRDDMYRRGPDGAGEWWSDDHRLGLAHRRLSIVDLSDRANQPMASACGRYIIVFNGEIYNFQELRRDLEARGRTFRTSSDTEVLLHLYALKGEELVHDLRGMFAIAIWDIEIRRLFLARDPYGIKPLYYADDGGTFRFASKVRSLLRGGAISHEIDPGGLVGFYLFGCVLEPLTIIKAIRAVPAGTTLTVDGDGVRGPHRYHSIAAVYAAAEDCAPTKRTAAERQSAVRSALLDSVKHHLIADVPVGAFLSAGIDSGALVGLMHDAGQADIATVTLSFEEFQNSANDEAPLAAQVARTYNTRHTNRVVTKAEFEDELPNILDGMDQPSVDGINSWFVSKAARECGLKVAISGVGGDELWGGYPAFRDVPRWVGLLGLPASIPYLGSILRKAAVALVPERFGLNPKAVGMMEYCGDYAGAWFLRRGLFMPWELDNLLDRDFLHEGLARLQPLEMIRGVLEPMPKGSFARVATLETSIYMRNQLLRDADWASMAHSLEVRTPLADVSLLDAMAALGPPPADQPAKIELASAPATSLPSAVLTRRKTGFGMPIGSWLQNSNGRTHNAAYGYVRDWARFLVTDPRRGWHTPEAVPPR